jgi:spore coat protein H
VYADPDDTTLDSNWPLIRLLLADTQYRAAYIDQLRAVLHGAFAQDAVIDQLEQWHALVAPYVVGPEAVEAYPYSNTSQDGFLNSLTTGDHALEPHVSARHQAVEAALAQ